MKKRKRSPKNRRKRSIYVLPNLITTASMFCGFLAVISSFHGQFEHAALAILVASLFDALDGRIARLTNTTSHFGTEYDSLSDLISFGVAPAVLCYLWSLEPFGRLGWLAAFLFTTCGALRLARFNVQKGADDGSYFVGLPIPAAAYFIGATVLFFRYFHLQATGRLSLLIMMYVLSFLMVSNIRYFSFKNLDFFRQKSFNSLVTAILIFVVVAARPYVMLLVLILAYVLSGPVMMAVDLKRQKKRALVEAASGTDSKLFPTRGN